MRKNSFIIIIVSAFLLLSAGCTADSSGETDPIWLTIGDRDIARSEAHYFLYSSAHTMRTYLPYIGWEDVIEDIPVTEFVKNEAINAMTLYYLSHIKANELSAALTDEQQSALAMWRDGYIDYYGSFDVFVDYLDSEGLTYELFSYLNEATLLRMNIIDALFGENGSMRPSREQLSAFAREHGYDDSVETESLREAYADDELGKLMDKWSDDVEVTLGDEFLSVDVRELYENFR